MKKYMRHTKVTLALVGTCLLAGCNVKDPIYFTDHPGEGKITLHTDWSNRGEGVDKPTSFYIEVDNYKGSSTADTHTVPNALKPGTYRAYLYNPVPGISVANGVATADPIASVSDWFFSCSLEAKIDPDAHHEFTAVMTQQTRRLTLLIELPAADANRVSGITAELSGITPAWDFTTNQPTGSPVNIPLTFSRLTEGSNAGKWAATALLLGTTGSQQLLKGIISYSNGTPASQALNSDLTTGMAGFNADKKTPLTLQGALDDHSITGTIDNWEGIDEIIIETE